MKAIYQPKFIRQRSSGIIRVRILTPRGGQWLSTGQTSLLRARQVCDAAKIAELQMAACSQSLSHEVVSRLLTGRSFLCEDILQAWREEALVDLRVDSFNNYHTTLKQWMTFGACAKQSLSAIKRCHLDRFVNEEGVGLGTRKGRLASLRSFYKFASSSGYCVGNPAERVKVKTFDILFAGLEPTHHKGMTEDEFNVLLASPKLSMFWHSAVAISGYFGLRIRDVACLEWASFGKDTVTVWTKKRGKRVALPMDDPLFGGGAIRAVLAAMQARPDLHPKFCFPDKREQAISPTRKANLSRDFASILVRHGIKERCFHSLRHMFKDRLDKAGKSIEDIARYMGHTSIETTKLYGTPKENLPLAKPEEA